MLPGEDDRELPGIEDVNADHDEGEAGHDQPDPHEGDGDADDRDEGGRAEDDLDDDASGADEGDEGQSPQVRGQSRGSRQFGELRRRSREAEARAAQLEQELQALRNGGGAPRKSPEDIRAEREAKLALMDPAEQARFLADEVRQETRNETAQLRFELADSRDAARFDALCARNPVFADLADEVERQLIQLRRQGGNSSREVVAKYILGDRAVKRATEAGTKQRAKADANKRRQAARPGAGQSDRSGADERRGGDDKSKRAKRLEGMNI